MLHKVAFLFLVIGGLNWLLVGLLGWDIGSLFGGQEAVISRIIYVLIGLSALVELFAHKKSCRECAVGKHTSTPASGADAGM